MDEIITTEPANVTLKEYLEARLGRLFFSKTPQPVFWDVLPIIPRFMSHKSFADLLSIGRSGIVLSVAFRTKSPVMLSIMRMFESFKKRPLISFRKTCAFWHFAVLWLTKSDSQPQMNRIISSLVSFPHRVFNSCVSSSAVYSLALPRTALLVSFFDIVFKGRKSFPTDRATYSHHSLSLT